MGRALVMKIPIRKGLFTGETSGDLMGFKCKTCNHILPPLTTVCCYCDGEEFDQTALSCKGKLYSYTIVWQQHTHYKTPYAVGYIELPEGFRIFASLKEKEGKPFKVGMDMDLVIETLWEENGNEIIGPRFQPA
jgi:uncharacterized OB-fold protein